MTIFLVLAETSDFLGANLTDNTATNVRRAGFTRAAVASLGPVSFTPVERFYSGIHHDIETPTVTPVANASRMTFPELNDIWVSIKAKLPLAGATSSRATPAEGIPGISEIHGGNTIFSLVAEFDLPFLQQDGDSVDSLEIAIMASPVDMPRERACVEFRSHSLTHSFDKLHYFIPPDGNVYSRSFCERGASIHRDTLQRYDFHASGIGSTEGRFELWVDNVKVMDLEINYFDPTFEDGLNCADFELRNFFDHQPSYLAIYGGHGAFRADDDDPYVGLLPAHYTEIIVADEDTRLMNVATLFPVGAGDVNEWSGTFNAVDEISLDLDDFVSTEDPGVDFQCALSPLPEGSFSVVAVQVNALAETDGAPGGVISSGIQIGGSINVDEDGPARIMDLNPITSEPWTQSEVEAMQINVRSGGA